MSAVVDKTVQVVEVGALVAIDANVLTHGVAFVAKDYPPMLMEFTMDPDGEIAGYTIRPVEKEHARVECFNFVKVGAVLENKSSIIGVQKTPKIIIPGA